jgi:hypothetical protein
LGTEQNNLPALEQVEAFLNELRIKLGFQEVFFDRRDKNLDSYTMLAEWGYSSNKLVGILKELTISNYSEGPIADDQNVPSKGDLWVFGKNIMPENPKRKKLETEFYIKVQLGYPDREVICISFHPSDYEMKYPFNNQ